MTAEEFGQQRAFPDGINIRTWLIGQGFQGILATGRSPGGAEILEELNPKVDVILKDLAARVPPKKPIPIPKV